MLEFLWFFDNWNFDNSNTKYIIFIFLRNNGANKVSHCRFMERSKRAIWGVKNDIVFDYTISICNFEIKKRIFQETLFNLFRFPVIPSSISHFLLFSFFFYSLLFFYFGVWGISFCPHPKPLPQVHLILLGFAYFGRGFEYGVVEETLCILKNANELCFV